MQYTYLLFNLFIISLPLVLSLEKVRIHFIKNIKIIAGSIGVVCAVFIPWDIMATARGHWSFNPDYITGLYIANLPIEEVLFFITVPFSCLFTYEVISYFTKKGSISNRLAESAAMTILIGSASAIVLFWGQEYTMIVLLAVFLVTLAVKSYMPQLFRQRQFWLFCAITTALFVVFNYFLTNMPVVTYSDTAIIGVKMLNIPLEDFLYNFSLQLLALFSYKLFKGNE